MRKIISGIIILLIAVSSVAYSNSDMWIDGFNLDPAGNDIDLSGRSVHNGTFNGTTNHSNATAYSLIWANSGHTGDNSKVNKTGDNMTGVFAFSDNMYIEKNNTGVTYWNGSATVPYTGSVPIISNSSSPIEAVFGTGVPKNANHVVEIWGGVNELMPDYMKTPLVIAYGGIEIYADDVPSSALSIGNNVPGTASTTDLIIAGYLASQGYWTQYFKVNGTTKMMTATNITVLGLAGAGNAYVCVDSTGKQYRGNPTC